MIQDKVTLTADTLKIMYSASKAYGDTLLRELERQDEGRKRSRHKESIKFIKRFNTTYELGAGEYLEKTIEDQPWYWLAELVAFLMFCCGICALWILAWAVMS